MSVYFLVTKMKQKKVICEYCGDPIDVHVKSEGPHYCGFGCEQMRKESSKLNTILSTDRRYTNIEEMEGWGELSITTALSQEDLMRKEAEAVNAKARETNLKSMNHGSKIIETKTVYDFNGEVFGCYEIQDYRDKLSQTRIERQIIRNEIKKMVKSWE